MKRKYPLPLSIRTREGPRLVDVCLKKLYIDVATQKAANKTTIHLQHPISDVGGRNKNHIGDTLLQMSRDALMSRGGFRVTTDQIGPFRISAGVRGKRQKRRKVRGDDCGRRRRWEEGEEGRGWEKGGGCGSGGGGKGVGGFAADMFSRSILAMICLEPFGIYILECMICILVLFLRIVLRILKLAHLFSHILMCQTYDICKQLSLECSHDLWDGKD